MGFGARADRQSQQQIRQQMEHDLLPTRTSSHQVSKCRFADRAVRLVLAREKDRLRFP